MCFKSEGPMCHLVLLPMTQSTDQFQRTHLCVQTPRRLFCILWNNSWQCGSVYIALVCWILMAMETEKFCFLRDRLQAPLYGFSDGLLSIISSRDFSRPVCRRREILVIWTNPHLAMHSTCQFLVQRHDCLVQRQLLDTSRGACPCCQLDPWCKSVTQNSDLLHPVWKLPKKIQVPTNSHSSSKQQATKIKTGLAVSHFLWKLGLPSPRGPWPSCWRTIVSSLDCPGCWRMHVEESQLGISLSLSLSLVSLSFSSFPLLSSFSLPPLAPWKVGGSCGLDFQKLLQIARQAPCSCVARLLLAVKASDRLLAQEDQNPWKAHDLTRESTEAVVSRIATMWLVRYGSDPTSVVVAITSSKRNAI